MNTIQLKISKTSKHVSFFLLAGCVITVFISILFVIAIAVLLFGNNETSTSLQHVFGVFTSSGDLSIPSTQTLITLFLFGILELTVLYFLFYFLYLIFRRISLSYTPFEKKQVTRIMRVASLTLIMCITSSIFDTIGHFLLYKSIDLNINFAWIVLAIVIYCLACIFDYGCQLQKESDETL